MKYVYVLQVAEESDDEVSMKIDSVYTTKAKAEAMGQMLVENLESPVIYYCVSGHLIFQ